MGWVELFSDTWTLAAVLLIAGAFMGFIAGLLGVGGGAILVPVLYEVFRHVGVAEELCLHLSIGTALLVMVPTSIRSYHAHKKRGSIDSAILRTLSIPVVIGVGCGIIAAKYLDPFAIKLVWVVCLTTLALRMFFARDNWRLGNEVPLGIGMRLYGVFVGCVSTLMSIGGGAFTSSMMTLYGRSLLQAVGTSSGVGPLISIPGFLGFVWAGYGVSGLPFGSLGYVSLIGAAVVIPASVMTAPWGARVAHGIPKRRLELIFASCLGLISLRFFLSL